MYIYGNNSNYPPGVSDSTPGAPWNEPGDNDPIEVDVEYSVVMMRNATIETKDYDVEKWDECERDDEGYLVGVSGETYTYDNVDWRSEYANQHMSPIELIGELEEICEELLRDELKINRERLKYLLEECKDWDCDEENVDKA